MNLPFVTAITATAGRHNCLERIVKYFLDQDYAGDHLLLIYNNSEIAQELGSFSYPKNKRIFLINNSLDKRTNAPYTNLGAIYRDALLYVPSLTQIVCHMDDDDAYLPNHISEGVKGFQNALLAEKLAYKPEQSWYRHEAGTVRAGNTLEPSIFIDYDFLCKHGYSMETGAQHLLWHNALVQDNLLLVDPAGIPTFIYVWDGKEPGVWKTSGDAGNVNNFNNYRRASQNHGDRIITPVSDQEIAPYYDTGSN